MKITRRALIAGFSVLGAVASAWARRRRLGGVPAHTASDVMSLGDSIYSIRGRNYGAEVTNATYNRNGWGAGGEYYGSSPRNCVGWFSYLTGGIHQWPTQPITQGLSGNPSDPTGRLRNSYNFSNCNVPGQSLAVISGTSPGFTNGTASSIFANVNPPRGSLCIVQGGTNDIYGATDRFGGPLLVTSVNRIISQARSYGLNIIVCPILDRTQTGFGANSNADRTYYNNYLESLSASDIIVADTSNFHSTIHASDPTTNGGAIPGDGTHPNELGGFLIGQAMANAWNRAFASASRLPSPLFTIADNSENIYFSADACNQADFGVSGGNLSGSGVSGTVAKGWTLSQTGSVVSLAATFNVAALPSGNNKGVDSFLECQSDAGVGLISPSLAIRLNGTAIPYQSACLLQCFQGLGGAAGTTDMMLPSGKVPNGVLRPYVIPLYAGGPTTSIYVTISFIFQNVAGYARSWSGTIANVTGRLVSHPTYGNWQELYITDTSGNSQKVRVGRFGGRVVSAIPTTAPANVNAPVLTVSGSGTSQLLTCTTLQGDWTGRPHPQLYLGANAGGGGACGYYFTFYRDGVAIAGAKLEQTNALNSATYASVSADRGHTITCSVYAATSAGAASSGHSNGIAIT